MVCKKIQKINCYHALKNKNKLTTSEDVQKKPLLEGLVDIKLLMILFHYLTSELSNFTLKDFSHFRQNSNFYTIWYCQVTM